MGKPNELNRRYCQAWRKRNRKAYNAYLREYRAKAKQKAQGCNAIA